MTLVTEKPVRNISVPRRGSTTKCRGQTQTHNTTIGPLFNLTAITHLLISSQFNKINRTSSFVVTITSKSFMCFFSLMFTIRMITTHSGHSKSTNTIPNVCCTAEHHNEVWINCSSFASCLGHDDQFHRFGK